MDSPRASCFGHLEREHVGSPRGERVRADGNLIRSATSSCLDPQRGGLCAQPPCLEPERAVARGSPGLRRWVPSCRRRIPPGMARAAASTCV